MPDALQRRSVLAGALADDLIQERRGLCIKRLYEETPGLDLPREPNRATLSGGIHALWVGPGEWLLVSESGEFEVEAAASELSHGRTVFRIPADAARQILAKGCPLDLRESIFEPGHCAQSILAATAILVHYLEDGAHMDIYVARSYGRFIHDWLKDAALSLIPTCID
ncbi:MAG: sarcosine oxidase subunit gamma family protein [Alphaproteobacteria bacterium]|nr:sarcosine oxidase subunit gamma family protein [Alphaproteobacteria bacterium]